MASVLIVDDEKPVRQLLTSYLADRGYTCVVADSSAAARDRLSAGSFELVLCDIKMPDESGLSLAEFILDSFPGTAVVMMSGIDDLAVVEEAVQLGVYGYLVKPLERNVVLICVINALQRRQLEIADRFHRKNLSAMVEARTAELKRSIQALKKAQAELQRSQESYRALMSNLPCAVYRGTADWSLQILNGSLEILTGYSAADISRLGLKWPDLIVPEDLEAVKAATRLALAGDGTFVRQYRIRTHDGRIVWLEDRGRIVLDADGRIAYIDGVFFDISAQKEAEQKITRAKRQWETTFDAVPDLIAIIDERHCIQQLNRAMAERLGVCKQDAIGKQCFHLVHRTRQPITGCPHAGTMKDNREHSLELTLPELDGHFLVSTSPLSDAAGHQIGCVHVARDISTRHQAAEELRHAHRELAQLVNSITSILIEVDAAGRIVRWNQAARETFDLPEEKVKGQLLKDTAVPWSREVVLPAVSACCRQGRPTELSDVGFTRTDGRDGFLSVSLNPIQEEGRKCQGVLILATDITEQRILEAQLSQAQKLESIGQLAAGIAHEINSPIQYVGDNLRFLRDAFTDMARLQRACDQVVRAAQSGTVPPEVVQTAAKTAAEVDIDYLCEEVPVAVRQSLEGVEQVSRIVRSMKEFSHPGQEEKTFVDLNRALESTVTVARNEYKYVADLEMDLSAELPPVPCLPGEMNQVFLNLLINAAHAIGEVVSPENEHRGTIRICTRPVDGGVEVRIGDTGPGIPEKIQNRIFDPFFTTKEVGRGTGQGLAISHAVVVEKHGGSITFETTPGHGTTFIVRLPVDSKQGSHYGS